MTQSVNYTEVWYDPQFTGYGGHTIFIHNSTVRIEGAEFKHMGQGGRMARYPVHWHHRGDAFGNHHYLPFYNNSRSISQKIFCS